MLATKDDYSAWLTRAEQLRERLARLARSRRDWLGAGFALDQLENRARKIGLAEREYEPITDTLRAMLARITRR